MDDIEDRLGDEDRVAIGVGPSTMFLHGDGTGSGVVADLVDLQERSSVREVGAQDRTTWVDGAEGFSGRARGLGENRLRQHDVLDGVTVGRLAVIELHLAGDFVAEAVATLRSDLLDSRTVRLESEGTGGEADLALRIREGEDFAAATIAGVDPAIGSHDEVIGHEVRVARGEAAIKDDFLVRFTVTVGVAQPDDVRLADNDDAILVMTEAGNQFEAFVENLLLIGDTISIGVDQYADLVLRGSVVAAGNQHAAFAPGFRGERATAVRVFRALGDPQSTTFIPLDRDGLVDQGFGHDDAGLEARLHLESSDSLFRATGAADRVTHIHEVLGRAEFIDIGATGRPSDATLDEGPIAGVGEGLGFTLQENRRTEARVLKDPSLRLDVVDRGFVGDLGDVLAIGAHLRGERSGEHEDLLVELEVKDRLVGDIESRGILGERMGVCPDVQHHQSAEATALRRPTRTKGILSPAGRRTGDGTAHRDEVDTTVRKISQRCPIPDFIRGVILTIQDDDFVLLVRGGENIARTGSLGDDRTRRMQFVGQRFDRGRVIGDDRHLDRCGG